MASPLTRRRTASLTDGFGNDGDAFEDFSTMENAPIKVVKEMRKLKVMCISTPEAGHLVPLVNVAVALALRQHDVQVVTCDWARPKMEKICNKAGCKFVGVAPEVKAAESGEGVAAEFKAVDKMVCMFWYYNDMMAAPVMELVQKQKPDVILGDFITPCSWEVADAMKIPVVINIPGPLAFTQLVAPAKKAMAKCMAWFKLPRDERIGTFRVYDELEKLLYDRPILMHTFFGLEAAAPIRPNIVVTGTPAPRLPPGGAKDTSMPELNTWLQLVRSKSLKVVYVTMGSMQILTKDQVNAIYVGLEGLKGCAVLWSLKEDQQAFLPSGGAAGLPPQFFVNKWLPQSEALQLPEVAVVVTHCGWGGLNETINAGKPIVATPFRADQPLNAKVAEKRGLAVVVSTKKMRAAEIGSAVEKVLGNPEYKKCAEELRAVLLRTGGAEKCAEAVEFFSQGCAEYCSKLPTLGDRLKERVPLFVMLAMSAAAGAIVSHKLSRAWRRP